MEPSQSLQILQQLYSHLESLKEAIHRVVPPQDGKILHYCTAPPKGFEKWREYHDKLLVECNQINESHTKIEQRLEQMQLKHDRDQEALQIENDSLKQNIQQLESQLAFYEEKEFDSQHCQCELISEEEYLNTQQELYELTHKEKKHCLVQASPVGLEKGVETAKASTCESFAQVSCDVVNVGVTCSTEKRQLAVQCGSGEVKLKHQASGRDAPLTSHSKGIHCRRLDHNRVKETEEKLREEIHDLTHVPKRDAMVEANLRKPSQNMSINCAISQEIVESRVRFNSKGVQQLVERNSRAVSCIPQTAEAQLQIEPDMWDSSTQIHMHPSEHKGTEVFPETSDSCIQYHCSTGVACQQVTPDTNTVYTECPGATTHERGITCMIFSEEVACQCDLIREHHTEHTECASPTGEQEEPLLSEESGIPSPHTDVSSINGEMTYSTMPPTAEKLQRAKKRKSRPPFCELCNIDFKSSDELQLHQEACHSSKRRRLNASSTSGREIMDSASRRGTADTLDERDIVDTNASECDICMLELFDGNPMYRLRNCGHYFHLHCVYRCLLSRAIPNRCVRCFTDIGDAEKGRIETLVKRFEKKIGDADDFHIYEYE